MASVTGMVTSFRSEVLGGIHDFTADTYKFALYDNSATLNSATTVYSTTNEISGTGYSAGGATLTSVTVTSVGSSGVVDAADIVWTNSTFTAAAGLLYNSSKANRAVSSFDFGGNRTVSNGTFTVQLPPPNEGSAFVEIDDT